jgi:DNA-binding MarR family transcriptional regulator
VNRCPGDADARFGAWVSMLNRAAHVYYTKVLRPFSLGPGQQAYLLVVGPDETLSQDEIAARLRVDKANVTRAVQGLCEAGYLERVRAATDRRRWSVSLTAQGRRVREAVETWMQQWVTAIRGEIPEERWAEFVETLEQIALRAMEVADRT